MARFLGNLVITLFGVAAVAALFPRELRGLFRGARHTLLNSWLGAAYWIASRRRWRRP
jgi:uncharacterized membrane protein